LTPFADPDAPCALPSNVPVKPVTTIVASTLPMTIAAVPLAAL